ncbi:MAG: hypothetical protein U0Y68_05890 [Blastocatellia bacterium]
MEMPSVSLALAAFLPVLIFGVGLFLLAQMVAQLDRNCGHLAALGFLLITLGGVLHALWRLLLALTTFQLPILHHSLLIFAAPGFVLLAWALWNTFHPGPSGTPVWVVPVIIVVIGCGGAAITALSKGGQRWFYILLGLLIPARTATALILSWQAWRRGAQTVAGLFLGYLIIASVQTSLLHFFTSSAWPWIEPLSNTLAGSIFAYAAWQFRQVITHK